MTPNINNFNPNMSLQEYSPATPLDLPVPQYVPLNTPTIYDPPKFDIPSLNTNVGGGKKGDGWDIDGFMRDLKTDRFTSNVNFHASGYGMMGGLGAIGTDYGKQSLEGSARSLDSLYDYNSKGVGVKKFKNFYDPSTDEDRLAKQQSAYEKILNGVVKMNNTAITTVARGIGGTIYGLGSSIINQDFSKLYDNELQNALNDWDMEVKSSLANYRTNEEKQRSFLGKMATVNFWADDFLQGVGYIGGIALTHYLTAGIGSRFSVALRGTTAGANPSVLASLGTKLSAVSNNATASMLAGASKDVLKTLVISGATEGATTALQFRNDAINDYINKSIAKNGTIDQEAFKEYVNDVTKLGNGVFATTSAISAASDLVQFGKILGINKGLSKVGNKLGINQIVNKFGLGTGMNKASSKFLKEGFEKGGQEALDRFLTLDASQAYSRGWKGKVLEHLVDKGVKMGAEALEEGGVGIVENMAWAALHNMYDVDNLYKTTNEIEGSFGGLFDWENFKDATDKQFSTTEGRHEMFMGALLGLVGGSVMRAGSGDFAGAWQELASNSYAETRRNRATALTEMQSVLKNDIERGMTSDNFGAVANSYVERIKRMSAFNAQVDKANEFQDKGDMFMADLLDSSASFDQMMMLSDKVFGGNSALDKSVQNLFNARVDALDNNALRLEHGIESDAEVDALKKEYKENFVKRQERFDRAIKYASDYAQLLNQDENSSLIDVLARQRYLYDTAVESKKSFANRITNSLNIVRGQEFQSVLDDVVRGYDKLSDRIINLRDKRSTIEGQIKNLQDERIREAQEKGDVENTKKGVDENTKIRERQEKYESLQQELEAIAAEEKQLEGDYNRMMSIKNALKVNEETDAEEANESRKLRSDLTFTEIAKIYDDINNLGEIAVSLRNIENYEGVGKEFLNTLESYTNAINAIDSMERFFDDIEKGAKGEGPLPKLVDKVANFFGKETKDRSDRKDRGKQAYVDENGKEIKSEEDQFVEDLVDDVINSLPTDKAKKKARANAEMMAITKALVRLQYRTRFNKNAKIEQQQYNFINALYERDPFETVSDEDWKVFANEAPFEKVEIKDEDTGEGTARYTYETNPKLKGVIDRIIDKLSNNEKLTLRERKIYESLKERDKDYLDTYSNQLAKSNDVDSEVSLDEEIEKQSSENTPAVESIPEEPKSLFEEVSRRIARKLAVVSKQTGVSEDDVLDIVKESSEMDDVEPKTRLQKDIESYKKLSEKENLTEEEEQELEDLRERLLTVDAAYNVEEEGSLLDDLDLLNQLNEYSEEKPDVSEEYTPDVITDKEGRPFSDEDGVGGRSANHAQNYSNTFMTIERDDDGNAFINLSNLSLKGFFGRIAYGKLTMTNKKGVETTLDSVDDIKPSDTAVYSFSTENGTYHFKYNKHGNILLDAESMEDLRNLSGDSGLDLTLLSSSKFSNYSPLYAVDEQGNYHPLPSDIEIEVKDGDNYKIDQKAVKELKPGDEVKVVYPKKALYNKRRTKDETSVKEDVLLLGDSKGRIVGVLKAGHGSSGQYENLMKIRNIAVSRVRNDETNRVFNADVDLIDTGLSVVVNRVENGHPNIQLSRDTNGEITNQYFIIPENTAKNVKVLGFGIYNVSKSQNDETKYKPSVLNKGVENLSLTRNDFRIVEGVARSMGGGVVSYVVLEYNGKTLTYPVKIDPSTSSTLGEVVKGVISDKSVDARTRAKMVNKLLVEQGLDIVNDPQYQHLFATENNIDVQSYEDSIVNELTSPVTKMGETVMNNSKFEDLRNGSSINIDLQDENIFFAPKFSMDFENVIDRGAVKEDVSALVKQAKENAEKGKKKTEEKKKPESKPSENKSSKKKSEGNKSSENESENGKKEEGKTSKKEENKPVEEEKSTDDLTVSSFQALQTNAQQKKWVRELARKLGFTRMMSETRVDGKVSIDDIVNYLQHKLGEDTPQNYKMAEHYKDTYLNNVMSKGKTIAYLIDNMIGEQISDEVKPTEENEPIEDEKLVEEEKPAEEDKSKKEKKVPPKIENKPVDNKKPADSSSISSLLSLQSNLAQKKWVEDLAKRLGFTNQLADTRSEGKVFDGDIINYITHKLAEDTPQNRKLIEFYRTKYLEGIAVKDKNKNLADAIDAMIENEASMDSEQQVETINEEASELFPESLFPETGSSEKTSTKKRDTKKDTKKSKKTTISDKNSKNNCK